MKYQVRQLGVGGVLDQAMKIVGDQAGLLFSIVGFTLVPLQAVLGFVQVKMQEAVITKNNEDTIFYFLLMLPVLLVALPLSVLVNAAVIRVIASAYLSRETTVGSCFRHAFSRLLPLIGTSILYTISVFGGAILCVIPGIIVAFWFCLYQHVVVLEGIAGSAALTRSRVLLKGSYLNLIILGVIIAAITVPINWSASFIPEKHLMVAVAALIQGVVTVIATSAFVVFYFSCRCKVENFDLQMLADAVGAESPALVVDGVDVIEP